MTEPCLKHLNQNLPGWALGGWISGCDSFTNLYEKPNNIWGLLTCSFSCKAKEWGCVCFYHRTGLALWLPWFPLYLVYFFNKRSHWGFSLYSIKFGHCKCTTRRFLVFAELCNHHRRPILEHFFHPERSTYLQSLPVSTPAPGSR